MAWRDCHEQSGPVGCRPFHATWLDGFSPYHGMMLIECCRPLRSPSCRSIRDIIAAQAGREIVLLTIPHECPLAD